MAALTGKPAFTVMLSSTFRDLHDYRRIANKALADKGFAVVQMEADGSRPDVDVITSSLEKVSNSQGYMLVLGERYGSVIADERNPDNLSTTHLEYRRAVDDNKPIAVVILGERCWPRSGRVSDAEFAAREDFAQEIKETNTIHGVADTADDLPEQFLKAADAMLKALEARAAEPAPPEEDTRVAYNRSEADSKPLQPGAPQFTEARPFSQGMAFQGRKAALAALDEWLASPDPMFVLQAMGGMGKSTVAFHWAGLPADHWDDYPQGRLWYSFYEEGASIADFCRYALAYLEGRAPDEFREMSRAELRKAVLDQVQTARVLLVMDGLERILKAYLRPDRAGKASEADSEYFEKPDVQDEDFCAHKEDGQFLLALSRARAARLLVTTRNMPEELLNEARKEVPGVRRLPLEGFDGREAVDLLYSLEIEGDPVAMGGFVSREFGGHPLMIGVIAGLITDFTPDPGNFDTWAKHPSGRAKLNLAKLDSLTRKRQHVLKVAFDNMGEDERLVLMALAMMPFALAYDAIETVANAIGSKRLDRKLEVDSALNRLLSRRLVTHSRRAKVYDLHPLVRSVARDWDFGDARKDVGEAVVDYTRSRAPSIVDHTTSWEEIERVLDVADAILNAGQDDAIEYLLSFTSARIAERGPVERFRSVLADENLEKRFSRDAEYLMARMACALNAIGRQAEGEQYARKALEVSFEGSASTVRDLLFSMFLVCRRLNRLTYGDHWLETAVRAKRTASSAEQNDADFWQFAIRIQNLHTLPTKTEALFLREPTKWEGSDLHADSFPMWWAAYLDAAGENSLSAWRSAYEKALMSNNIRHQVTSANRLAQQCVEKVPEYALRLLQETLEICQARGIACDHIAARIASIMAATGDSSKAQELLNSVCDDDPSDHRAISEAYEAIGETMKAHSYALSFYEYAWADGPPYAHRLELKEATALLERLNIEPPDLPYVTPDDLPPDPLYDEALAYVEKLEAEHHENGED